MAYTKTNWVNNSPLTPINDINLNKMEQGIFDSHSYHQWRNIEVDPGGTIPLNNIDNLFILWNGAVTVQLPAAPTQGDRIRIADAGCDFNINNLTINRNGQNIHGAASNYTYTTNMGCIELVYSGLSYGWVVINS